MCRMGTSAFWGWVVDIPKVRDNERRKKERMKERERERERAKVSVNLTMARKPPGPINHS